MTLRLFIISFLFSTILSAQDYSKIKFGKVVREDLEMLVYEPDSSAEAVILNDLTSIWLNSAADRTRVAYERHIRLKILTKEGIERGDIEIPFYSWERSEDISQLKVVVHQPDGSKYVLSQKEKHREKNSKYWSSYKFNAPRVQVGSIIEYKYRLSSKRLIALEDWHFQTDIPIRFCQLSFDLPNTYEYAMLVINPGLLNRVKNIMIARTVPAMKHESFITTMNDYRGRVRFQLQRYMTGSFWNDIFSNWPKLAKELQDYNLFGKQYTHKKNYIDLYKELEPVIVDKSLSTEEKINKFYHFILDNVEWNGEYRLYAKKSLNDAFKKGTGNSAELNMMMLAMLNESGIKAYPAILSPRHMGKSYPFHPFLDQFKHMMVLVETKGKDFYLDLSDKWRAPGLPRTASLNGDVWIVNPLNPRWKIITPKYGEDVFYVIAKMDKEFNLHVDLKGKYSGYNSITERKRHDEDSSGVHWKKRFAQKFPDTEVISASCENLNNLKEDFKDEIKLIVPGAVQDGGNLLYIDPFLYSNYTENPFKLKERNFPVDFSYPNGEKYIFQFEIPEGYEVEELPESIIMSLEGGGASFRMISSSSENSIQIIRQFRMKKTRFMPKEYGGLQGIFDRMVEKSGELIVLKKT